MHLASVKIFTLCFLIAVPITLQAQNDTDPDKLFEEARILAAEEQYDAARALAGKILAEYPDYHEVRVFRARTYAWQNRFREARSDLDTVLNNDPENNDALSARTDVEIWARNYNTALQFANRWLESEPGNASAYLKRAEIYLALKRFGAAKSDISTAESLQGDVAIIKQLRFQLSDEERRNITALGLSYDYYTEDLEPWQRLYFEYHRLTDHGPVIARLNVANRFDETGLQIEADAYPAIGRKWYAYLNAGISNSNLFPGLRLGAEIYRELPSAFEASLGLRYLNITNDDVIIFTGSVSKYWRDWFFSARPFVTPQDAGTSLSVNLMARRYFGNPLAFASLSGGYGFSPDERRLVDADSDNRFQQSYFLSALGNYPVGDSFQIFGEIRFTSQELPGFIDHTYIYTFESGLRYRF